MCSNAPIGKKKGKIQNAQQCAHWKKNEKNSKCATMCPLEKKRENIKMQSNVPIGKSGKCKMRSNVPIGKKFRNIKNAHQCVNSKCAAMCQFKIRSNMLIGKSEKFKMHRNMPIGKKLTTIQNAQQCAHLRKMRQNSKSAAMYPSEKN